MVNRINPCVESIWIFFGKQQVAPSTHLGRQQGSYPSHPRSGLMWCDYHAWGRSAFVYPLLRFPPRFANFFRFRVIISFIWHPLEIERITNIMNGISYLGCSYRAKLALICSCPFFNHGRQEPSQVCGGNYPGELLVEWAPFWMPGLVSVLLL